MTDETAPKIQGRTAGQRPHRKNRRWFLRPLVLVTLLIAGWHLIGFGVAFSYLYDNHHNPLPFETPAERGLEFKDVSIPVDVGTKTPLNLSGWFLPADTTSPEFQQGAIVVMLHGFGSAKGKVWIDDERGYRGSLFDQGAESLVRAGFHVLLVDFRNFGGSDDDQVVSLGVREAQDVLATLKYIRERLPQFEPSVDPTRIGIRGPSMGGATAIMALGDREPGGATAVGQGVHALWLDSTFASAGDAISDFLGHHGVPTILMPPIKFWLQELSGVELSQARPIDHLKRIDCPTMVVHSKADTMISVDHFYQYQAVARSMPNVETWLVDGREHHRLWLDPEYLDRQVRFFRTHLGKPPIP